MCKSEATPAFLPSSHPVRNRAPAAGRWPSFPAARDSSVPSLQRVPGALPASAPAERRRLLEAPFPESLLPAAVSPDPNLHAGALTQPGFPDVNSADVDSHPECI